MDRNIKIEIKDRIAHLVGIPKIICGNNDYSVTFTFDDEWSGIDVKTLRVSYNNKYSDHVFSGDTVELPPIIKAVEVYLGVFAGDITSTKVAVRAEPSILCAGGSVADPEPDVYGQIIDLINAGKLKGDPGEKGEKGDPGKDATPEVTREDIARLSEEIDDVLDVDELNLVDTATLASKVEYAGAPFDKIVWDADNGYAVCRTSKHSTGNVYFAGQPIPVKEGDVLTVSAYVNFNGSSATSYVVYVGFEKQNNRIAMTNSYELGTWTRVHTTITVDATTAADGYANVVIVSEKDDVNPMYIKDIQVTRGESLRQYCPQGTVDSTRMLEVEQTIQAIYETGKGYVYISHGNVPIIEKGAPGRMLVTLPSNIAYIHNGLPSGEAEVYYQADILASLGAYATAYGKDGVVINMTEQSALIIDTVAKAVKMVNIRNVKPSDVVLLTNGYYNPSGHFLQLAMRERLENVEARLDEETGSVPDMSEEKLREYAELFNGTAEIESFLFFTDPHTISQNNLADIKTKVSSELTVLREYYDNTPTSFAMCTGDWIDDDYTPEQACFNIGLASSLMRAWFDRCCYAVGNHEYNDCGTEILPRQTVHNLLLRDKPENYYVFDGDRTKFYVLDSGRLLWSMTDYGWEQIDWLANVLLTDNARFSAIVSHCWYIADDNENLVLAPFADAVLRLAQAYNTRATITLNNKEYSFASATGHVEFAIGGHKHTDKAGEEYGIPVILTTTSAYTGTKATFDLVLANYTSRKINFVRVGLGESRTVTLPDRGDMT